MRNIFSLLTFTVCCLISGNVQAHSEKDKARFVANEGKDVGRCDNVLRPCQSIAYAVQQANKGDKILVASGQYKINSSNELFYLKSALVPVLGGYNRFDHFQSQSPDTNITTLTNVPAEMATELRKQGFSVLADGKSLAENQLVQQQLSAYYSLNESQSEQSCNNGKAGIFECENIDLLAHMPLENFSSDPGAANDVWGHVDLNTSKEYALIGLQNGVAVVDVSTPENPVEVGTIRGKSSGWRDIKVYQYYDDTVKIWRAFAYATIDNASDYVTIIDLNHLPNSVSLVEKNRAVAQAHNVYITNVDHTLNIALPGLTPTLQLIGSSKFSGAFHSYSLTTPETLTLLSQQSAGQDYTHDGATIVINDERKNTDCANNDQACIVFIDFNEKEMKLWNISDAKNVIQLSTATYTDVNSAYQYVHSGWGSEDKQYIFLHDETDEKNAGINSTVRVFSIADLNNPQHVGQWTGPTPAIDHNGFVRGNRYYMSNYERGLTVLDITNPPSPVAVGSFDTFTPSNSTGYYGAWGTYPFLPSGNILISDINSGLYILKDNTLSSVNGTINFTSSSISTAQGQDINISIQRTGGVSGSVSVDYQIIPGSAKAPEDFAQMSGTLQWSANDNANKVISVAINPDESGQELAENFFIRLSNPKGGVTLSSPSYLTVNVDGQLNTGVIGFVQNALTVAENQESVQIEVARDGSSQGSVSVSYRLESNSAIVDEDVQAASGALTWQDGDNNTQTISLTIIDDSLDEENESFTLTLESIDGSRLNTYDRMTITISDDDSNNPPQVSVIEDFQVNTGQTVSLSASATDPENDALNYMWQQISGTTVTLSTTDELTTSFVAPSTAGNLEFSLTATDSKLAQTTDSVVITIVAPPQTPQNNSSGGGSQNLYWLLSIGLMCCWRQTRKRV
ncbi:choice-of-anchor B family protein [Colwelliaceae bacterium 6471]